MGDTACTGGAGRPEDAAVLGGLLLSLFRKPGAVGGGIAVVTGGVLLVMPLVWLLLLGFTTAGLLVLAAAAGAAGAAGALRALTPAAKLELAGTLPPNGGGAMALSSEPGFLAPAASLPASAVFFVGSSVVGMRDGVFGIETPLYAPLWLALRLRLSDVLMPRLDGAGEARAFLTGSGKAPMTGDDVAEAVLRLFLVALPPDGRALRFFPPSGAGDWRGLAIRPLALPVADAYTPLSARSIGADVGAGFSTFLRLGAVAAAGAAPAAPLRMPRPTPAAAAAASAAAPAGFRDLVPPPALFVSALW